MQNIDFKDNSNNIYIDPNAYIQQYIPKKATKKVVFQEPYENLPNFYINNNFVSNGCNCKDNKKCPPKTGLNFSNNCKRSSFCNENEGMAQYSDMPNQNFNNTNKNQTNINQQKEKQNVSNAQFSLKNLFSFFGGNEFSGITNLLSLFGNSSHNSNNSGFNTGGLANILNNFMSNKDLQSLIGGFAQNGANIGNLFDIFKKKSATNNNIKTPKSSDICIKDYVRVD